GTHHVLGRHRRALLAERLPGARPDQLSAAVGPPGSAEAGVRRRGRSAEGAGALMDAVYKDATRSSEDRTEDLLSRMTLEEKVAQMLCIWQQKPQALVDARGNFDLAKASALFASGEGLGQVGRPSDAGGGRTARQMAELTNEIQAFFIGHSRLGIP